MTLNPRAVIVHRRSEFDELLAWHGTRQQAEFFLSARGRTLDEVESRHQAQQAALQRVSNAIPLDWRRGTVERADLDRFIFGPEDVVIAVGQDGLVANLAKYLNGQIVVGLNPEPDRNPGVLVPHAPDRIGPLLRAAAQPASTDARIQARVMVEAVVDDHQSLRALNEIFVGHPSHQSARYRIQTPAGHTERHSSSGVLIGTGTGATGWCRSVWQERHSELALPRADEGRLCWFVREAWPSPATGTDHTEGLIGPDQTLSITAESDLVIFGDGIETDALQLRWGQRVTLRPAADRLHLLA